MFNSFSVSIKTSLGYFGFPVSIERPLGSIGVRFIRVNQEYRVNSEIRGECAAGDSNVLDVKRFEGYYICFN